MLESQTIRALFASLNDELAKKKVIGEVGICGGAVMCLVFNARESTKDVDGIFEPSSEIREAAARVADEHGVSPDWLNDGVKGYFLSQPNAVDVINLSNLRVWAPSTDYMLAMKCISARFDSHDADDVRFLIRELNLKHSTEVMNLIEAYYPKNLIPAKTQYFIEEIFGE